MIDHTQPQLGGRSPLTRCKGQSFEHSGDASLHPKYSILVVSRNHMHTPKTPKTISGGIKQAVDHKWGQEIDNRGKQKDR